MAMTRLIFGKKGAKRPAVDAESMDQSRYLFLFPVAVIARVIELTTTNTRMPKERQPPSFFPTTALVNKVPFSSFLARPNILIGSCSCRAWCRCRHHPVHATSRPSQGQIPGHNPEPTRRHWEVHMALFEGYSTDPRLARSVPRNNTQYCRERVELGPLFSLVCTPITLHPKYASFFFLLAITC